MGDFFHGWRRKLALVTLTLATLLALAWVRSISQFDFFTLSPGALTLRIGSLGGAVRLILMTPLPEKPTNWSSGRLVDILQFRVKDDGTREEHDEWEGYDVDWRWDFGGCHFGQGALRKMSSLQCEVFCIPYLYFVLPLTILSAYLLLCKVAQSSTTKCDDLQPVQESPQAEPRITNRS